MNRAEALASIHNRIAAATRRGPVRVGLDGRSAAGKSTLAGELAQLIRAGGVETHVFAIDDFHPLGYKHRRDWTPARYYADGYDIASFRDDVLRPLGPGGSRRSLAAKVDALADRYVDERWIDVSDDATVLVDGFMLARPEFVDHFDVLIWIEVSWQTMLDRAAARDVAWVGDRDAVLQRYRDHWIPMHEYYERRDRPRERADLVLINEPFDDPQLTISDARLAVRR